MIEPVDCLLVRKTQYWGKFDATENILFQMMNKIKQLSKPQPNLKSTLIVVGFSIIMTML